MHQIMNNEIISFTTRKPRKNEVNGIDYTFLTKEEILKLQQENRLIEFVEYRGNYYGITKDEFEDKLNKGHAFVIVDYHGFKQLKELYDNVVSIYFKVSPEEAYKRMLKRGDSIESIRSRMKAIDEEQKVEKYYDFVVINEEGKQDKTISKVREFIDSIIKTK